MDYVGWWRGKKKEQSGGISTHLTFPSAVAQVLRPRPRPPRSREVT